MKLSNRQKLSIGWTFQIALLTSFAWALFSPDVNNIETIKEAEAIATSKWAYAISHNGYDNTYRVNDLQPTLFIAALWIATSTAIAVFEDKS